MTRTIKNFKGSLNPIFKEDGKNDLDEKLDNEAKEQIIKNYLLIDRIQPNPHQPRKIFNEKSLEELTQSIKSKGVIQPIIVLPIDNGFYEIIVGERRWRAAKQAGLDKIPAIVRDNYENSDRTAVALIENIQRENLNPIEEAEALQRLVEECSMTHNQVAEIIGKSRATVSNLLRLLDLDQEVKSMIHSGFLEMGHARALLSLESKQQLEAANIVVNSSLSVRKTEKLVQKMCLNKDKRQFVVDSVLERKAMAWRTSLSARLSSKVDVQCSPNGKGKVIIHFDSIEEADWLMDHIRIEE